MEKVLVWDLPVRLFHWMLVLGFGLTYFIAKILGEDNALFHDHMILGLTIGGLVALRVVWGFVGTRWARWSTLFHRPQAHAEYFKHVFRSDGKAHIGHNPASSLAITVMLLLVLALAFTGYQYTQGNKSFKDIHPILANVLAILGSLHIVGVVLHQLVKRDRLVLSMVDGKKLANESDGIPKPATAAGLVLLVLAGILGGGLYANYNPQTGATRWPILGAPIQLGETVGGEAGEGGAKEGQGEQEERED